MKIADITIYEDDDLIAVNKAAGMLSVPDREGKEISLKKILEEKFGRIFIVHRLDKGTSGIILFAKNEISHRHLSLQFQSGQIKKIYLGLVAGSPEKKQGRIDAPIAEHPVKKGMMVINRKGKESLTDYKVLEDFHVYSLAEFQIHTGRTHQIRVHASHIGHPIVCDELYGDGKPVLLSSFKRNYRLSKIEMEEKPILSRTALHAEKLMIRKTDGESLELKAPLSKDMKALITQLSKNIR